MHELSAMLQTFQPSQGRSMMRRSVPAVSSLILAAVAMAACQSTDRDAADKVFIKAGEVRVVAREYAFEAPDTLPYGWTTLEFENHGQEPHFMLLSRMPEGRTMEDYARDVGPAFDSAWAALQAGASKADAGGMLGRLLPAWYGGVTFAGGPGLVSPGESVRTTLDLEPGTYVMECYVKTPEGKFHAELGMHRQLVVTDSANGASPPSSDLDLTIANDHLDAPQPVTAGRHVVAVHFAEQPQVGLGNDVHVARLQQDTDVGTVAAWMDWMNVDGLRSPAPVTFLGGAQEMPAGQTAYFVVTLNPGRYAWVPEAGDPARATVFTVQ